MTNGEKLDQIFPDGICPFSHNWLKSEYKQSNSDYPKCNTCIHKNEDVICYGCVDNDEYVSNSDEDCISRAEALKNLALTNSKDDVYRMINSLSSVQPKTDVLDKIRAEISEIPTISFDNDVYKADILEIIDKYKAEKE